MEKPLIEKVIAQARQQSQGLHVRSSQEIFLRAMANILRAAPAKYRWSESGLAMTKYLLSLEIPVSESKLWQPILPQEHLWMQFDVPVYTPVGDASALMLMLTSDIEAVLQAARSYNPPPQVYHSFRQALEKRAKEVFSWALLLFGGADGRILWATGFSHVQGALQRVSFTETPFYRCPRCYVPSEALTSDEYSLCPLCAETLAQWVGWLRASFAVLSGAFQEQEREQEPAQIVETCLVKEPRADKPNKFHEVQREHRYRYVAFDACVRRKATPVAQSDDTQHDGSAGRSWLSAALEVDPESVVYVPHMIAAFEREYRAERYVNVRGQRQQVQPHRKRVPVKLRNLGRVMTRVIASTVPFVGPARAQTKESTHA